MNRGYIKLWRKIQDSFLWKDNRVFSNCEAFIDMIFEANHKERTIMLGMETFTIKRGESFKSLETWASRWKWSRSRVRRFFNMLIKCDMIRVMKTTHKTTHLIICKYDTYQGYRNADETLMKRGRNADETLMNTNNNDKNGKNDKNEKEKDLCLSFLSYFNSVLKKSLSLTKDRERIILQRIKEGRTLEDLKKCVDNFSKDTWSERHKFTDVVYCIGTIRGINNFDKWISFVPSKATTNKKPFIDTSLTNASKEYREAMSKVFGENPD